MLKKSENIKKTIKEKLFFKLRSVIKKTKPFKKKIINIIKNRL